MTYRNQPPSDNIQYSQNPRDNARAYSANPRDHARTYPESVRRDKEHRRVHVPVHLTAAVLTVLMVLCLLGTVIYVHHSPLSGSDSILSASMETMPEMPVAETTAEPMPETSAEPVTETVVETSVEAVTKTVAEPVEISGESTTEPVSEITAEPVPETFPEPVETVGADRAEPSAAQKLLDSMILREKIYQLFIVEPSDIAGVASVTSAGNLTRQGLEQYPVGGLIYDRSNMRSQKQVRELLRTTQTFSKIPLFLTCDEEGGRVSRLMSTVETPYVGPMLRYRSQGAAKAYENAQTISKGLLSCAFNMDFAPVADVWSNPSNKVIGDRAYSTDYAEAAELVSAAVHGFHDSGIICTLKHFPGHGDTTEDSHSATAYVHKSYDELREGEFLPFQAGINAGADFVMIGHLTVGDIDPQPAPFSYKIVTEILRGELGFDGVIITDGLQMGAMTEHYTSGEIAVRAIRAGVDMLLCPEDFHQAAEALWAAVESGELTEARLNESVLRILTLKERYGLLP